MDRDKQPTKTVQGYFGPKQLTRDEFIERWSAHCTGLFNLADTVPEFEEVKAMRVRVMELAGRAWDRIKEVA